jgi:hypothetical protein
MTAASIVVPEQFSRTRACRVSAAAELIGLAANEIPTGEQLAHLAWHVAAVEPSELRHFNRSPSPGSSRATCLTAHQQTTDDLDELLPLPHPLDYEWRFDPHTRLILAERTRHLAGADGPIALLGAPTLAPALCQHIGDVLLLDANARLLTTLASARKVGAIQLACADLGTFTAPREWQHRAAVVVCDPPWYPEGFATFLYAAAQLVRPGGTVLLSTPDLLTRPSVASELDDLSDLAIQLQLVAETVEPCSLRYRTPFFEYRALLAAGVGVIPLDWRAGTLWQFTSAGIVQTRSAGRHRAAVNGDIAAEVTIDRVRLRILAGPPALPGVLELCSIVPGDTLPSVSRRHPARSSATLWTSGNTVLSCADPYLAGLFLKHLARGFSSMPDCDRERLACDFARRHALSASNVWNAMDKLTVVLASENADLAAYCMSPR